MKTLPGLPALPEGYYWKVAASRQSASYNVELVGPPRDGGTISRVLGWGITRSWPRPGARSIARTARKLHRVWTRQQSRELVALVGTYRGGAA